MITLAFCFTEHSILILGTLKILHFLETNVKFFQRKSFVSVTPGKFFLQLVKFVTNQSQV